MIFGNNHRPVAKGTDQFHAGTVHIDNQLAAAMWTLKNDIAFGYLHSRGFNLIHRRNVLLLILTCVGHVHRFFDGSILNRGYAKIKTHGKYESPPEGDSMAHPECVNLCQNDA